MFRLLAGLALSCILLTTVAPQALAAEKEMEISKSWKGPVDPVYPVKISADGRYLVTKTMLPI